MYSNFTEALPNWVPYCAGFYLLASFWLGWRRGPIRQAASLAGLLGGVLAGSLVGPILAPAIPSLGFPSFFKPVLAGAVLCLCVWCVVMLFSSIIFRKTEEQDFGLIRFFFGITGAALGLVSAVAMLCLGAWGVRCFGSFAEGLQPARTVAARGKSPQAPEPEITPWVNLKKAVDASPLGGVLNQFDPLPRDFYPRLQKIARLLTNPKAKERFLADPTLNFLAKNPKLLALQNDPALAEALQSADLWSVLRNQKVLAAASDTQLLTLLRASEFDKALDRALTSGGAIPPAGSPPGKP